MWPGRAFMEGFLLSLSLCADLGMVNVAMIRVGLSRGARSAAYLGMGSCVGDLIYAGGSVSLVSLLAAHRAIRWALWIGGSAVLLWLAVRMLRETWRPPDIVSPGAVPPARSPAQEFGRGAMLALGSPTAILWFAAVGGSVIAAHAGNSTHPTHSADPGNSAGAALLPFFAGFFAAGTLWTALVAALTGYARRRLDPRWVRGLRLLSAVLFAYFAVGVFMHGYREFVAPPGSLGSGVR